MVGLALLQLFVAIYCGFLAVAALPDRLHKGKHKVAFVLLGMALAALTVEAGHLTDESQYQAEQSRQKVDDKLTQSGTAIDTLRAAVLTLGDYVSTHQPNQVSTHYPTPEETERYVSQVLALAHAQQLNPNLNEVPSPILSQGPVKPSPVLTFPSSGGPVIASPKLDVPIIGLPPTYELTLQQRLGNMAESLRSQYVNFRSYYVMRQNGYLRRPLYTGGTFSPEMTTEAADVLLPILRNFDKSEKAALERSRELRDEALAALHLTSEQAMADQNEFSAITRNIDAPYIESKLYVEPDRKLLDLCNYFQALADRLPK